MDNDILKWMGARIIDCSRHHRVVAFLDEVNTTNSMGLFKEIVCDRSMNGHLLPHNLLIIAACNPYRLRKGRSLYGVEGAEGDMAGLVFEHHNAAHEENVGTGIRDPLKNLVYRVHPLPESMVDNIFDFGALSQATERLYIAAMVRRVLGTFVPDLKEEHSRQEMTITGAFISTSSYTPLGEFLFVFCEVLELWVLDESIGFSQHLLFSFLNPGDIISDYLHRSRMHS